MDLREDCTRVVAHRLAIIIRLLETRVPSPATLFFGQVPPVLATVPRHPDGPRQIHRFPSFLLSDFRLSAPLQLEAAAKKNRKKLASEREVEAVLQQTSP